MINYRGWSWFCSIRYDKNKETEGLDLRRTAAQFNELRLQLTCKFIQSENDVNALLDEDGHLKLRTYLNIFIGEHILDRGITVANLIGFYYGRIPQKLQHDAVLQHSRMYGYRSKENLVVTRFKKII